LDIPLIKKGVHTAAAQCRQSGMGFRGQCFFFM